MSKTIMITNCFIIILSLISVIKNEDYVNRFGKYNGNFDCYEIGNNENKDNIDSPEECFDISPRIKWNCCYFEYDIKSSDDKKYGCMRYRKDNETDLNDLKYYISKLSTRTVLKCRQYYITYPFILSISLLILFLF